MNYGLEVNTERNVFFRETNKHQLRRRHKGDLFSYETLARLMSRALSRNMVVTVHGTCGSLGYLAIFFINILIILGVVFSSYELLWRSTKQVAVLIVVPRIRYQELCKKQAGRFSQSEQKRIDPERHVLLYLRKFFFFYCCSIVCLSRPHSARQAAGTPTDPPL